MSGSQDFPNVANLAFVESLLEEFLRDPGSVDPQWRRYFEELGNGTRDTGGVKLGPTAKPRRIFQRAAVEPPPVGPPPPLEQGKTPLTALDELESEPAATPGNGQAARQVAHMVALQDRVDQLIRAFRVRGHMVARLDPLRRPVEPQAELELGFYALTEADLERRFSINTILGSAVIPLRDLLELLRNTYCRFIGIEFYHMHELSVKKWLQERMEGTQNRLQLTREEQIRILTRLTDAVIFEDFIQKKFPGAKSFSLEGAESLVPLLDLAIEGAGDLGVREIVMAMAHRGRLNVLANIMGKSPRDIFREFEDADPELFLGRGDVKYHLGYNRDWVTASGEKVHLTLCFNPSHLEFVNPVALGRVRAKQDRNRDRERARGMAILIHGDASFAGEGITQETLNLSRLEHYQTGGTLHIIVNNQIGFTTPPVEGRSSTYATGVAKMLQIPIFHVNGEDPESVAQVVRLALQFRQTFKRDVVIDMYCYRRRGHNEGDEPAFTQPLMYKEIGKRPSVRDDYLKRLLKLGGVTREEAERITELRREVLERELSAARGEDRGMRLDALGGSWAGYYGGPLGEDRGVETSLSRPRLSALLRQLAEVPAGFHLHPKLEKWMDARREMADGKRPLDWSAAEALALARLSIEGIRIRLTGQDSERGTFSHRHAVLHDAETGETHTPLQHLSKEQAPVEIANSPLSETGVLGFEYGYSLDTPEGLVLWEAQFGDFANVAQVIIDQFIVSGEDKWQRLSGLVLLLPHGFEGQGPEHSSARLERFLMLAADDNIQVIQPTTPAQLFHALCRQALRRWRKPLIVMTPKSLLRHPKVVSPAGDFIKGAFQSIIPDALGLTGAVNRVLLCSGKIYYELEEAREKLGRMDTAILRLEQLYPLPDETLAQALEPFPAAVPVVWVQEEPENMGAWRYLRHRFGEKLPGGRSWRGVTRAAAASPATGSGSSHRLEQKQIIERALGPLA
ncbi:MAG: 2-oxoglutarate dehydrogenase E1 component [Nitrospirae bacterium]|nr:2-oxoglutarate dehydrogenase E1 component [Nitrospirota bacterium]